VQHCGEYRVIYHKNNGNRFFLSFEAKYPNPEIKKGKAGCFAVADFWKEFNAFESRSPCLAKSSANGLDLTLSATKTVSPLVLMSVLNSSCYMIVEYEY
jgi:hypothetical protein